MRKARWTHRPDILSYIIDAYSGLDDSTRGKRRRVFIWQDGEFIKMGNCEAFYDHLCGKFGLIPNNNGTGYIHNLLSDLGESVEKHKFASRAPRTKPYRGAEPDEWVIGRADNQSSEE